LVDQLKHVDTADKNIKQNKIKSLPNKKSTLLNKPSKAKIDTEELTEKEKRAKREKEWAEIENLVVQYQAQFYPNADYIVLEHSKKAAEELIKKFYPLFKKYLVLLKSGQIDFNDGEMKMFIASFIDEETLKNALQRRKQKAIFRQQIYQRFNFIKETYGSLPEEEIKIDLDVIFLEMAKRYKQIGRSFCGYLYNSFRYEVSRHIKKFTRNPLNIHYRNCEYEDYMRSTEEVAIEEDCFEDKFYENSIGIPDLSWISGKNCSDIFQCLTPLERKLLVKYYMEEWNDRQIAEEFGIHINTCNQKRRQAVAKLAAVLGINEEDIKRNRKSGKKAIIPFKCA
jgi:DNA-directed RNA polymerase specialized sigma24 family protein